MQYYDKLLPISSPLPLQAFLNHLFQNHYATYLKVDSFIFCVITLVDIKFTFIFANMWHVTNYLHFSCMFFKSVLDFGLKTSLLSKKDKQCILLNVKKVVLLELV